MSIDVLVTVYQYHVVNESLFKSIAFNEGNDSVVGTLSYVMYIVVHMWQCDGECDKGFQAPLRKILSLPHHKFPSQWSGMMATNSASSFL